MGKKVMGKNAAGGAAEEEEDWNAISMIRLERGFDTMNENRINEVTPRDPRFHVI